jgi:hypothetical protein
MTPTSAPTSMNSWAVTSGSNPPSPKASPASRYRGMAERPSRPASRPRIPSPRITPPSSSRTTAPWFTAGQLPSSLLSSLMPWAVPTTTRVSLGSRPASGAGAGMAPSPRTMATIDTPVRLRAWVSAIDRPA